MPRDQIEIDLLDHSDPGPKILTIQNAEILAAKLSGLQTTIPASLRSDSILPNLSYAVLPKSVENI